ncbi:MAG: Tm-1-like ATP-binding domain-containing protein [Pseudomonadota bacterium]
MPDKPGALIVATMDTKGREARYVEARLREAGLSPLVMDGGIRGECEGPTAVHRETVARAGGLPLAKVRELGHEGRALSVMVAGAVRLAREMFERKEFQGVICLGGSMGTTLGTAVLRSLPLGVPKVMVSTMASRDTRAFVGTKDILMLHAVCDLAGLNRLTRRVLRNGALALAGMLNGPAAEVDSDRPLAALSTLGTTEVTAMRLRALLDARGWEVVTFHTVGAGGQAMDEMIRDEDVRAVIDLSLHELLDHRFGGDYDAGPERGLAALRKGSPAVLVPGNIDFLVTGPERAALAKFPGRPYHMHNDAITVVRADRGEIAAVGRALAGMLAEAAGPVHLAVPLGGFSAFDHPSGGPLPDPEAPAIFLEALGSSLRREVPLTVFPGHVNDPEFADLLVEILGDLGGGHEN